jgi:hypothetical protein
LKPQRRADSGQIRSRRIVALREVAGMDAPAGHEHEQVVGLTGGSWQQASRCANGSCVQARLHGPEISVRSSRDPDGARVSFDRDEWRSFVAAVKAGEFDVD